MKKVKSKVTSNNISVVHGMVEKSTRKGKKGPELKSPYVKRIVDVGDRIQSEDQIVATTLIAKDMDERLVFFFFFLFFSLFVCVTLMFGSALI